MIDELLATYDGGGLTTKELLVRAFFHLSGHPEDIAPAIRRLLGHPDQSVRRTGDKLLELLRRGRDATHGDEQGQAGEDHSP